MCPKKKRRKEADTALIYSSCLTNPLLKCTFSSCPLLFAPIDFRCTSTFRSPSANPEHCTASLSTDRLTVQSLQIERSRCRPGHSRTGSPSEEGQRATTEHVGCSGSSMRHQGRSLTQAHASTDKSVASWSPVVAQATVTSTVNRSRLRLARQPLIIACVGVQIGAMSCFCTYRC